MDSRARNDRGFTFLEIMAVIVIIGVLAAIVAINVVPWVEKGRITAAKQQIGQFAVALDLYHMDNGFYPTTSQGLDALIRKPASEPIPRNWNPRGYLKKRQIPKDPWSGGYLYESPGRNNPYGFDLYSLGADGKPGGDEGAADITNWETDADSAAGL